MLREVIGGRFRRHFLVGSNLCELLNDGLPDQESRSYLSLLFCEIIVTERAF